MKKESNCPYSAAWNRLGGTWGGLNNAPRMTSCLEEVMECEVNVFSWNWNRKGQNTDGKAASVDQWGSPTGGSEHSTSTVLCMQSSDSTFRPAQQDFPLIKAKRAHQQKKVINHYHRHGNSIIVTAAVAITVCMSLRSQLYLPLEIDISLHMFISWCSKFFRVRNLKHLYHFHNRGSLFFGRRKTGYSMRKKNGVLP